MNITSVDKEFRQNCKVKPDYDRFVYLIVECIYLSSEEDSTLNMEDFNKFLLRTLGEISQ